MSNKPDCTQSEFKDEGAESSASDLPKPIRAARTDSSSSKTIVEVHGSSTNSAAGGKNLETVLEANDRSGKESLSSGIGSLVGQNNSNIINDKTTQAPSASINTLNSIFTNSKLKTAYDKMLESRVFKEAVKPKSVATTSASIDHTGAERFPIASDILATLTPSSTPDLITKNNVLQDIAAEYRAEFERVFKNYWHGSEIIDGKIIMPNVHKFNNVWPALFGNSLIDKAIFLVASSYISGIFKKYSTQCASILIENLKKYEDNEEMILSKFSLVGLVKYFNEKNNNFEFAVKAREKSALIMTDNAFWTIFFPGWFIKLKSEQIKSPVEKQAERDAIEWADYLATHRDLCAANDEIEYFMDIHDKTLIPHKCCGRRDTNHFTHDVMKFFDKLIGYDALPLLFAAVFVYFIFPSFKSAENPNTGSDVDPGNNYTEYNDDDSTPSGTPLAGADQNYSDL